MVTLCSTVLILAAGLVGAAWTVGTAVCCAFNWDTMCAFPFNLVDAAGFSGLDEETWPGSDVDLIWHL